MRPATSGRSVTDSSERRLPTVVIDCGRRIASTVGGLDRRRLACGARPARPPPLVARTAGARRAGAQPAAGVWLPSQ